MLLGTDRDVDVRDSKIKNLVNFKQILDNAGISVKNAKIVQRFGTHSLYFFFRNLVTYGKDFLEVKYLLHFAA